MSASVVADFNAGIVASAPGKLVIVGEYAVIYGAPAMVAAVPRRAQVTLIPRDDSRWQVTAPGLDLAPMKFASSNDPKLAKTLPLLSSVLAALNYQGSGQTAELNTQAFFSAPREAGGRAVEPLTAKLGLGSSAALCTALMAGVAAAQRGKVGPDKPQKPELAVDLAAVLAAHREFQGGRGSGIDVAASYLGGCLNFQLDPKLPSGLRHQSLPLPVPMVWVWSGQSAATTARLDILSHFQQAQPGQFANIMQSLSNLSRAAGDAALAQAKEEFLCATGEFTQVLADLDQQINLGVWTDPHHKLAAVAQRCGVLYKTSGAGGGDCGLALSEDLDRLKQFRRKAAADGFPSWDMDSENPGLTLN